MSSSERIAEFWSRKGRSKASLSAHVKIKTLSEVTSRGDFPDVVKELHAVRVLKCSAYTKSYCCY